MGGIFESFALLREYKEEAGEELTQAADRIQAWRKDRRAMQLQTGYKHGGKTGSYAAADRIQRGRKDRELCSCREDTNRKERQEAVQL